MADPNNPTPEGQGGGTPQNPPADNKGGDNKPKISDDDVVNHPMYKGVYNDMKETRRKLQEFEDAKAEEEKERLEKQGEFQKLAETEKARADEFKGKYEQTLKYNAFVTAAAKAGVTLLDDAWKLADTSKITLDGDGKVAGIEDVVKTLVTEKPFLAGKQPAPKAGEPSNPPNGGDGGEKPTFKRSQLRDTKFFNENKVAIMEAAKNNRIVDDITPAE